MIEPRQDQLVEARGVEVTMLAIADGEQDGNSLGNNAASREHQRIRGQGIQPLRVIDHAQQRTLLGRFGEQRQHAC